MLRSQLLCRVGGQLLEGPAWDAAAGRLLFVDILRAELLTYDWVTSQVERLPLDETCSAWIPRKGGGSVVACRSGVRLLGGTGAVEGTVQFPSEPPENRSNDAKCDPRGRLWVGTMSCGGHATTGALYRIDGRVARKVLTGITISNGLGWSPEGRHMYYVDTPTWRIDALDYDLTTGEPSNRHPLVDTRTFGGVPDGLAVDAQGCLWVAFYDGRAVRRFAPDGQYLGSIEVPAARPTSCAFAGPGLARLVITTAGSPDGSGGDLYVCDPGVAGSPVSPYDG